MDVGWNPSVTPHTDRLPSTLFHTHTISLSFSNPFEFIVQPVHGPCPLALQVAIGLQHGGSGGASGTQAGSVTTLRE